MLGCRSLSTESLCGSPSADSKAAQHTARSMQLLAGVCVPCFQHGTACMTRLLQRQLMDALSLGSDRSLSTAAAAAGTHAAVQGASVLLASRTMKNMGMQLNLSAASAIAARLSQASYMQQSPHPTAAQSRGRPTDTHLSQASQEHLLQGQRKKWEWSRGMRKWTRRRGPDPPAWLRHLGEAVRRLRAAAGGGTSWESWDCHAPSCRWCAASARDCPLSCNMSSYQGMVCPT